MMLDIRKAGADDLDSATRLFLGYLAFYGKDHSEDAARRFLAERVEHAESVILLGRREGADIAFAQIYPTFSSTRLRRTWVLNDLFVAEPARGQGVGRELLRDVVARARAADAALVSLQTAEDNVVAQALYESEGFAHGTAFRSYTRMIQ
ncbi:GNAT family N-acetyltransferase [Microbacterium gilvum]|uniref:GNAT family N-acetyltransferase n=1 Tax=Microbacterium gilvum TaxID=1336204 RepID=A0ABP9A2G7_9MICO